MGQVYEKRGYLLEDFRLFHQQSTGEGAVDYHYHTFHKVIFLLGGHVVYDIEGQTYDLRQGDVVLVGCGDVHRPVFQENSPYDRIIFYISPEFLEEHSPAGENLGQCFVRARADFSFVVAQGDPELLQIAEKLEKEGSGAEFASGFMCNHLFFQMMVLLNRAALVNSTPQEVRYDEKIRQVLQCIHNHLTEPLSLEEIATQCFMSPYHMMRKFKEETGYSIHQYRVSKRLFLAKSLVKKGVSPADACFSSGFRDYSAFARAYKKQFGTSPKGG